MKVRSFQLTDNESVPILFSPLSLPFLHLCLGGKEGVFTSSHPCPQHLPCVIGLSVVKDPRSLPQSPAVIENQSDSILDVSFILTFVSLFLQVNHFHFSLSCTGEGNGNPLQCSCLENPRDGGAWRAAVQGVAKSSICPNDWNELNCTEVIYYFRCY